MHSKQGRKGLKGECKGLKGREDLGNTKLPPRTGYAEMLKVQLLEK